MRTNAVLVVTLLLAGHFAPATAQCIPEEAGQAFLIEGADSWSKYLTDDASGQVTAAGMLGISGEAVTTVENVRSIVMAVQGLNSNDSGESLGFSITPARTTLAPMELISYAKSWPMRLLGSLTLSYARGATKIEDADYERSAYAVDTNAFLKGEDDPVVAYALAVPHCLLFDAIEPDGSPDTSADSARRISEDKSVAADQVRQRAKACREQSQASLRWNRSQVSLSYGEARIRPKDHSKPEGSLGRTLASGVIYGFGGSDTLSTGYALTLNYRRTQDEPVLDTLALPDTVRKDSSLFIARLCGGTDTRRVLVEMSNARSHDITASQRAFKQAVGIGYRVFEGAWLNLRFGKQRKIDGSGTETGSLLTLSYSPKALLTR